MGVGKIGAPAAMEPNKGSIATFEFD